MARTAWSILAAAGCLAAASAALAAPFAMITDLKGEAWAMEGGKARKLSLLSYIENPTEIKVDSAGKLAITYFANGIQYSFSGPARLALDSAAPKVIEGQGAQFKKVTPEKSISGGLSADQWRRLQQATVVMRAVKSSFAVVGPDKTAVIAGEPDWSCMGRRMTSCTKRPPSSRPCVPAPRCNCSRASATAGKSTRWAWQSR